MPENSKQIRRLIVLKPLNDLAKALIASYGRRALDARAIELMERLLPAGVSLDRHFYPIARDPAALQISEFTLAAMFDSDETLREFVRKLKSVTGAAENIRLFTDPVIQSCVCPADGVATGTFGDVRAGLGFAALAEAGTTGQGVRLVVVDYGVDEESLNDAVSQTGLTNRPNVAVTRYPTPVPAGDAIGHHGVMVAFDALIAAPDADVWEYPLFLLSSPLADGWTAHLSQAMAAFDTIRQLRDEQETPQPTVVVNSWAMFDTSTENDLPASEIYSNNREHPFNETVVRLVESGVDVVFAAGNCGGDCPRGACGQDFGPGKSIHGANSLDEVITAGAVDVNLSYLCFSSEGEGRIDPAKPDLAGYSHFGGSRPQGVDTGTSAACPVVAGVVAALRSSSLCSGLTPTQLKSLLVANARPTSLNPEGGWHPRVGHGVVDAGAVLSALAG